MKQILVTFRPLEPFFFGGDRSFTYGETVIQRSGSYFIRSRETPSQTTLFGALRYLGLTRRDPSFCLSAEDAKRVGPESYNLQKKGQSFHWIHRISPLYLLDENHQFHIRTPFDHRPSETTYSPWEKYTAPVQTMAGERIYPEQEEYAPKEGLSDSWLCLHDLSIHQDCFYTENEKETNDQNKKRPIIGAAVRVGVSTASERATDGFFKKEWRVMPKHRFAFTAEVDESFSFEPQTVYLGQKKAAFEARMLETVRAPDTEKLAARMHPKAAIALSDVYIDRDVRKLYELCAFVCAGICEHRSLSTMYGNSSNQQRFKKGEQLIRLIKAGSVFLFHEQKARDAFLRIVTDNDHARIAGFNHMVYRKEWRT